MGLAEHPFSRFVRDLPQRQTISQIMSALQLRYSVNANLLLYCLWYALTEQGRLRRAEFKKLQASLHPWHERIVLALQRLADSCAQVRLLRQWVADEAQTAVQFERQMLAQVLPTKKLRRNPSYQLQDACHNLAVYFKLERVNVDESVKRDVLTILRVLFTDSTDDAIARSFTHAINIAHLEDSGYAQLSLI